MGRPDIAVEILFQEGIFISFDFTQFAFVIKKERRRSKLYICAGKEYWNDFQDFSASKDGTVYCKQEEMISFEGYKEALNIANNRQYKIAYLRARKFIEKMFPSQLHEFIA